MRRYAVLVVLAALAGLVVGAVAVEAAPQPKPPTQVEVVNDAANAVPVEVTNAPGGTNVFSEGGAVILSVTGATNAVWNLVEGTVLTDVVVSYLTAAPDPDCYFQIQSPSVTIWTGHGAAELHLESGIPITGPNWTLRAALTTADDSVCSAMIFFTGYTP